MAKNEDTITLEELTEQSIPKETQKELDSLREALIRLKEERHYVAPIASHGNTIRFGIKTDIHTGSMYERFDALHAFYDLLRYEKITTVLNAGDVLDGNGMYRGQEYEQYAHGFTRQLNALEDKHPSSKNIREVFITGNHDYSFDKQVDLGVGPALALRMGWEYAGRDQAWVELVTEEGHSFNVGLYHPDGGTAYALSYKMQKLVEQIPGGKKPDMVAVGHFHKSELIPRYRNVCCIQAGCFQSQTSYMARKPTDAHVGGWIIEVVLGARENLASRVRAEFIGFYEPKETVKI